MTVSVYRIGYNRATSLNYLYIGTANHPGRWHVPIPGNSKAVVYAAGTRALAQLEKRVHCNGVAPADQALIRLDIRSGARLLDARLDLGLRAQWRVDEAYTQQFGMRWFIGCQSLGLWVPSFVEPEERNLMLNPQHLQYSTHVSIVIEQPRFEFDPRLF